MTWLKIYHSIFQGKRYLQFALIGLAKILNLACTRHVQIRRSLVFALMHFLNIPWDAN